MKAVNLLPSDQRGPAKASGAGKPSAPKGDSFGAYVLIGALALAVVAVTAYVLTTNTIKDRQTQLSQVRSEAEAVKAKAAALQPFADFKALSEARVATVQGLVGSRFNWESTLRDMSRAMPRDVHLKSFKGTTGTSVAGTSGIRSAVQAPAIELAGCTTSQSGVARLMARLRAVRGVTRVSLAKSDKDGVSSTVAPSGGGNGGSLCRRSGMPSFEVVVFFERSAIPATAAPTAPAAPAAGSATAPSTPATPGAGTAPGTTATNPAPSTPGTTTAPATPSTTQGVSAP